MIYTLLVTLIVLLIISYYLFGKKIIAPAVILNAVYIFSTLCAIYNVKTWNINLHTITYWVIVGGNLAFIITAYMIHLYFEKKNINNEKEKIYQLKYIEIKNIKLFLYIIIVVLFCIIYGYNVLKLARSYGDTSNYTKLMATYRSNTSYGDDSLPSWLMKLFFLTSASVYMGTYIFINNILCDKKRKKNYLLLIPMISFIVTTLVGAERANSLNLFIFVLIVSYVLSSKKYKYAKKINNKYIKRGVVGIFLFLVFFSVSKGMVGRTDESDATYYITSYAGGSIQLLDMFIRNPSHANYFGEELFRDFKARLSKFGLIENNAKQFGHLEFRISNGINVGNVYTAYRKYIHDFGYFSILPLQIILALFYSIWYEKIMHRKIKQDIDISVILYAFMCIPLFKHSIQEGFYSTYLNSLPITCVYLILWKYYFTKVKVKYGKKQIM